MLAPNLIICFSASNQPQVKPKTKSVQASQVDPRPSWPWSKWMGTGSKPFKVTMGQKKSPRMIWVACVYNIEDLCVKSVPSNYMIIKTTAGCHWLTEWNRVFSFQFLWHTLDSEQQEKQLVSICFHSQTIIETHCSKTPWPTTAFCVHLFSIQLCKAAKASPPL